MNFSFYETVGYLEIVRHPIVPTSKELKTPKVLSLWPGNYKLHKLCKGISRWSCLSFTLATPVLILYRFITQLKTQQCGLFLTAIYLNKDKARSTGTKRFLEEVTQGRLNVYCKITSDISLPDSWD